MNFIISILSYSLLGEAYRSEDVPIPFVPYPTNPHTGAPVKTKLKPMERRSDLRYGAPMADPITGLHAPILAVTIHPQTGAVLPIAGTHTDPVTGLPIAIEMGSLMVDPATNDPVPILGVTLDCSTGETVPIGGSRETGGGRGRGQAGPVALMPGDVYVEPMSGQPARIASAFLSDNEVLPASGGYLAMLDANMLACEARALDCLR